MLHRLTPLALLAAAIVLFGWASASLAADAGRPNIVVIIADDLGYHDVGFHGCEDVPTPHLDSLAKSGVRFTSGYVSCPVCSPTRAGFLASRYQQRFGHEFNNGTGPNRVEREKFGLPLSERTIADTLKAAGYKTGLVGKWHQGFEPQYNPVHRGFDEFYGFLGGAHSYVKTTANGLPIHRGLEPVADPPYLTDKFGEEAVAFIDRHEKEPFFLLLTFNAVHTPLDPSPSRAKDFAKIEDPKRRAYASMLASLDDAVGAVQKKLASAGLTENTLVAFFADNGGPQAANGSNNSPLRGNKGSVWEGGVRVPFVLSWPAKLPAGATYDQPVISLDVSATAAAVAGAKLPADRKIDGVNLIPYVTGDKKEAPHESLYWRFGKQSAVRQGQYKLVKFGDAKPKLFDVNADLAEARDLANEQPEIVAKLSKAWDAWNAELVEPLWGPGEKAQENTANRVLQEAAE